MAAQILLGHGSSIHARDNWTPLHQASYVGYSDIIRLLLEHGSDLEAQNVEQDTPLHLAARRGKVRVTAVQILLKHRASIHARGRRS